MDKLDRIEKVINLGFVRLRMLMAATGMFVILIMCFLSYTLFAYLEIWNLTIFCGVLGLLAMGGVYYFLYLAAIAREDINAI